ncbi:chemotaxis protein CheB [Pseudoxanthomonas sp.]|uniref:chemotaxis protein CheB n=1 Tax=Pseudoxanthomonas sp. TaxID=1871049 RepID=UPI002606206D|nr:chemotaxis protein CheB [Pseudoxanthomonas sp.]WDS37508.1 MAG: chemotaxis protein CheB [Pseudoxanthomonas sp.]
MSAIDSGDPGAPRVALLARPGIAREQLRGALVGAGAQIALEDDPNVLDVHALAASAPHAVLVALEPAIEEALARLDPVLGDPGLVVIYDEADLASSREGWDAQRWARHLAAKLHGHRNVLPPGAEIELPQSPEPGRPQAPALVDDAALDLHLDEAVVQSASLPDQHVFGAAPSVAGEDMEPQPEGAFSIDAESWTPPPAPARLALVDDIVPVGDSADDASAAVAETIPPLAAVPAASDASATSSFQHLSLVEDFEVVTPVRGEPMAPPPLPPGFGGLTLELESLELPEAEVADPDATGSKVPGAALLFAGIGGPDAVRRVLAGLPVSLELPVLVHLRLDGGRYDNLTKQIQRVSPLPVVLARVGMAARAGYVYVVPDDVAAEAGNGGMVVFAEGSTDVLALLAALPPGRTAVLLLSGADAALAEPALMLAARGALVSGQSLHGCYDWAAAKELERKGGTTASPEDLALRLIEHIGG